ncbi:CPBP family intramembrane glutamic endopeptidase [Leucobacter sp. wl10]|uniref:CPBP family intramembrane glutamic endopeptidase n=1 Tax=Leucobacter sp. wl10 TaxID=2304677 RepID=UPI000E5B56B3|nr:type II CAAX endopeptidase family protein [Leucobacter sp. wl10]RGE21932.1 CPBP family intramembrane metalloprotease [Leucobacter sp. wl10]
MTGTEPEQPRQAAQPEDGGGQSQPAQRGAPQEWAWARPPRPMRTVETEPLEYHRLLRGVAGYRWWKPLLLLLLAGAFFGILTVAVTLAFVPVLMAIDPGYPMEVAAGTAEVLDTQRPASVLVTMVSIIIMIPSVMLAMLVMGMRPVGRVWSVATRIRWGLLWRLCGAAVLAIVVMNLVGIGAGIALDPGSLTEPSPGADRDFDVNAALLSLLLVLLLVPLQSTAEEVVFRGLFMQVLGAWFKNPWFAILIPSVGFASLHIYDIWGLLAVGLLGAVSAWLTWRTGGLEAAIAIHIVNNYIAFGIMASGITGETAQTSGGGSPGGVIGQVVGLALFAWLTLRVFKRGGHGRERIDLIQMPLPVPAPDPQQPPASQPRAGDSDPASRPPGSPPQDDGEGRPRG